MPNWCENTWDFYVEDPADLQKVKDIFLNEEGNVTFDKLVPMPKLLHNIGRGSMTFDPPAEKPEEVPAEGGEEKEEKEGGGYSDEFKEMLTAFGIGTPTVVTSEEHRGKRFKNWYDDGEVCRPLTKDELKELAEIGYKDWYEWCCDNWGTKWDACSSKIVFEDDHQLTLYFETAWAPPEPVAKVFREKYPDIETDFFYKEPGMRLCGWIDEDNDNE